MYLLVSKSGHSATSFVLRSRTMVVCTEATAYALRYGSLAE
jgi:hypothetical protein